MVTCIDFRFQKYIEEWARHNIGERDCDRVAWAGGIFDADGVFKQLSISKRLHAIKRAIIMNHEECGAYGKAGTYERHVQDLKAFADRVKAEYPDLAVETYYIHLDGTFEKTQ